MQEIYDQIRMIDWIREFLGTSIVNKTFCANDRSVLQEMVVITRCHNNRRPTLSTIGDNA